MFSINLRKIIIVSRFGPFMIFAIPFFIAMLFVTGHHTLISLLISATAGIFFGLRMTSKFRRNNEYFIQNIKSDHYDFTKKYNKLFKEGKLPNSQDEQTAYLKYLNGLQKINDRSVRGEYTGLTFLTVMFILSLFIDDGSLTPFFGPIIGVAINGFVRSRKQLRKIEYLRNQIHVDSRAKT